MFLQGRAPAPILPKLEKDQSQVCLIINLFSYSDSCIFTDSETEAKQPQISSLSTASQPRSPRARGPRTPRKIGAQPTRLEAIDDSLGPLGPLGENLNLSENELPPAPPSKEQMLPIRNTRSTSSSQPSINRITVDSADDVENDGGLTTSKQRLPHPGVSGGAENSRRTTQPSVSIEQAARPTFDITVGDPHKVGDLTSSHIVYQVRTKVCSISRSTWAGMNLTKIDVLKGI